MLPPADHAPAPRQKAVCGDDERRESLTSSHGGHGLRVRRPSPTASPTSSRTRTSTEPDRFVDGPDKGRGRRLRPFSFIGFGGGRHGCMGTNFAYLQIKAIWAVLLREFEFEMVDPLPEVGEGGRRGGRALFFVFVSSPPTPPPRPLPRTARLRLARRRPQIGAGAVPAPQAGARGQVRGEGVGKSGLRGRGTARDATGERVGASATRARDRVLPWGSQAGSVMGWRTARRSTARGVFGDTCARAARARPLPLSRAVKLRDTARRLKGRVDSWSGDARYSSSDSFGAAPPRRAHQRRAAADEGGGGGAMGGGGSGNRNGAPLAPAASADPGGGANRSAPGGGMGGAAGAGPGG